MNREKILQILHQSDDPRHFEAPPDFDYVQACQRVERFMAKLGDAGIKLKNIYLKINDSTHFAECHLSDDSLVNSSQGCLLLFSLFGGLVFIECPSENIKDGVLDLMANVADSLSLHVVPFEIGEESYEGPHHCGQWRERFFEYY